MEQEQFHGAGAQVPKKIADMRRPGPWTPELSRLRGGLSGVAYRSLPARQMMGLPTPGRRPTRSGLESGVNE